MVKSANLQGKIDELNIRISEITEVLPRCTGAVKSVNEAQLEEARARLKALCEQQALESK